MFGSRKKEPSPGGRAGVAAKAQVSGESPKSASAPELLQDEREVEIAESMFQRVINDIRDTGVSESLIKVFKVVRHWPSLISNTDASAFIPEFGATGISAEEISSDDETVTRVSFTYMGEQFDFVSTLKGQASADYPFGNITLHENGEQLVNMKIQQIEGLDHFVFRDMEFIKFSRWIDKLVQMDAEIEKHNESGEGTLDKGGA